MQDAWEISIPDSVSGHSSSWLTSQLTDSQWQSLRDDHGLRSRGTGSLLQALPCPANYRSSVERSKEQLGGLCGLGFGGGEDSTQHTPHLLSARDPQSPHHLCLSVTDALRASQWSQLLWTAKGASKFPPGQEANLKAIPGGKPDHQAARWA